jgi:hypothetical protein
MDFSTFSTVALVVDSRVTAFGACAKTTAACNGRVTTNAAKNVLNMTTSAAMLRRLRQPSKGDEAPFSVLAAE